MSTITLDALGRMSAAELRAAIDQLSDDVLRLHLNDDGTERNVTKAEAERGIALMNIRNRAEAMLVARQQFEQHPDSVEMALAAKPYGTPAFVRTENVFSGSLDAAGLSDHEARNRALRGLEQRGRDLPAARRNRFLCPPR